VCSDLERPWPIGGAAPSLAKTEYLVLSRPVTFWWMLYTRVGAGSKLLTPEIILCKNLYEKVKIIYFFIFIVYILLREYS
jgi:hypothetical protein